MSTWNVHSVEGQGSVPRVSVDTEKFAVDVASLDIDNVAVSADAVLGSNELVISFEPELEESFAEQGQLENVDTDFERKLGELGERLLRAVA
jgi:hypothetical protein